jgi:hypothetical protein
MGGKRSEHGKMINAYEILFLKPTGKRPLGRHRCRWKDTIKTSDRNGRYRLVYHTGTLLFLNVIQALINTYYIHLSFFLHFLTVYPCFAFEKYEGTSKFPFRALNKMDLSEMRLGPAVCPCKHGNNTLASIKGGDFLD